MKASSSVDITGLLLDWRRGEEQALEQLMPLVYQELRRVARRQMAGERPNHTLQPSALVNEAYLKLIDVRKVQWQNRTHFFAMAARLMRRVLVDAARRRRSQKRGGGAYPITLQDDLLVAKEPTSDLVAIDDALNALARVDERKARVVELRFFAGLSIAETAEALSVSPDTIMRDWRMARTWLLRELSKDEQRLS